MIRFFQIIIVFLIVVFVGVAIAWNSFPSWLSRTLSEKAGVPVSIGDISVSPWSISVDRFRISNPPRSILPNAFTAKKTKADVPLTHFLRKDLVIPQMTLENIYLGIELESLKSKRGNWDTIIKNFDRNSDDTSHSDRTVTIEKLVLLDLQIEIVFYSDGEVKRLKPIKRLEFHNVGSKGGLPIEQITKIIMKEIMNDIIQKKLQNLLKDLLQPGNVNPFKGLFLNDLSSHIEEKDLLAYTEAND